MKLSIVVLCLVLVVAFVVTAGCTHSAKPQATPVPTVSTVATTVAPKTLTPAATVPAVGMGTPGPTETLPASYTLDFMVQGNGNTANPYMGVSIRGGNGMNTDSRVDVNFTKPDGTKQQSYMLPPFYVGQNVTFPPSEYQNRVEILVTAPTAGKVKTYDQIVAFKGINP
jgi:hypothetical protein